MIHTVVHYGGAVCTATHPCGWWRIVPTLFADSDRVSNSQSRINIVVTRPHSTLCIALMSLDVIHTSPAQHLSTPSPYIHAIEPTHIEQVPGPQAAFTKGSEKSGVQLEPMWVRARTSIFGGSEECQHDRSTLLNHLGTG
jgi:hypothetical protein